MSYTCEWYDCEFVSDDFEIFYEHVREHTTIFGKLLYDSKEAGEDGCHCLWRSCVSDPFDNEPELIRHVLFHGFHVKLKVLGLMVQTKANLAPCILDTQARNLVPEFPEPLYCLWDECGLETSCPRYYYRHMDVHADSSEQSYPNEIISCEWKDCTFKSRKRNKLKEHCRTHTHEKCFSCPNCGGLYANKTKFTDHLRRQNTMESESYQCSHCLRFCASERILRDHMRHHINNVKCPLCDMTCPTQSALQHHMSYRHSDAKPFSCNMCENSFKTPNDLRRHQQTHDPLYSFLCEVNGCNYAAKTTQSLRRHHKFCHDSQIASRYECHICGSRYSRGAGLSKHLKKAHTFRWPSGHHRFRYKEDNDGMFRLQTVRFESVELSEQLQASRAKQAEEMDEESATEDDWEALEETEHDGFNNTTPQVSEDQLQSTRTPPSPSGVTSALSQAQSSIISSAPTHQNFLDVLNRLHEQCQQDSPSCSTVNTTSHVPMPPHPGQSRTSPPSARNTAGHDDLDIQEAVSLLAMLRNSGMTYQM